VVVDKQYYYKIIGTGMSQKGVKINFICTLQVSRIILELKINFYNQFPKYSIHWTERIKTVKCRGFGERIPRTQGAVARMAGLFY
jgi:hypothetical protein